MLQKIGKFETTNMGNVYGFLALVAFMVASNVMRGGDVPFLGSDDVKVALGWKDPLPGGVRVEKSVLRQNGNAPVAVALPYMGPVAPVGVMRDGLTQNI